MIEGKLKEIRQLVETMKSRKAFADDSRNVTTVLEGVTDVVDELFKFMIEIRELQLGSDPGGTIPPGRSLMEMHNRIEDLEVRIRRASVQPIETYDPILGRTDGGDNFRQLVNNLRQKPGLDVADERDRAILWAADEIRDLSHSIPVIAPLAVPIEHGRLKRVDVRSDDISPEFQQVLDGILQLKLSEAEAVWTALRACDPMAVEFKRDGGRSVAGSPADFFAGAVKAAVGLQSDLESQGKQLKGIVNATAEETFHVVKLREGLQEVFHCLERWNDTKKSNTAADQHGKDALVKVAALLSDGS